MLAPALPASAVAPWRGWRVVRLVLVALALVALVGAIGWGERRVSLAELEVAVRDGHVSAVRVVGTLPPGAGGEVTQEVHWRAGLLRYRAETRLVRNRGVVDSAAPDTGGALATASARDVGESLSALDPALRVTRAARPSGIGWTGTVLGAQAPGWVALPALLQWLGGVFVLVNGPQPWRATRWGWFWLTWLPLGVTAFLLLSGPLRSGSSAGAPSRRLRAGWAFVLSAALGAVVGTGLL